MKTTQKSFLGILSLLAMLLGYRLLYLFLVHPDLIMLFPEEELLRGAIGKSIADRLPFSPLNYLADNFSGGSLVLGFLTSFSFSIFGETLLALKLAPLGFSFLALAFFLFAIKKHTNTATASYFGLLFVFAPLGFSEYSVTAMGFHIESILFSAIAFWAVLGLTSTNENGRLSKPVLALLLGLTCGFGLWFVYTMIFTILTVLLFWFSKDLRFILKRNFWLFALAFLIGFSPWILVNLATGFQGLHLHERPLWAYFALTPFLEIFSNIRHFAGFKLLMTVAPPSIEMADQKWIRLCYAPMIITTLFLGILSLVFKKERSKLPDSVLFAFLFLLVFIVTHHVTDLNEVRYRIPAFPFLLILMAFGLEREKAIAGWIPKLFLGFFIILSFASHSITFSLKHAGRALPQKGYSYSLFAWQPTAYGEKWLCQSVEKCLGNYSFFMEHLAPEDLHTFSIRLALRIHEEISPEEWKIKEKALKGLSPTHFHSYLDYYFGKAVVQKFVSLEKSLDVISFLEGRSPQSFEQTRRGVLRNFGVASSNQSPAKQTLEIPIGVPKETLRHFWYSYGQFMLMTWVRQNPTLPELEEKIFTSKQTIPEAAFQNFLRGIGTRLCFIHLETTPGNPFNLSLLETFPAEERQALLEGLGMGLEHDDFFGYADVVFSIFKAELTEESIKFMTQGKKQFIDLVSNGAI